MASRRLARLPPFLPKGKALSQQSLVQPVHRGVVTEPLIQFCFGFQRTCQGLLEVRDGAFNQQQEVGVIFGQLNRA
jgi:hypothetical protein